MDSNALFAVLLLLVALSILIAEVFIPTGGILGITTFFTLLVSVVFAYKAWGTSHPNIFGVYCVLVLLLVPTVAGIGLYLLPGTPMGKRAFLEAPPLEDLTPYLKETQRIEKLIGRYGIALTMLNPGGFVKVDDQRLHALADGLSIESGASVKIVDVRGAGVIVTSESPPGNPIGAPENSLNTSNEPSSPFDFEFPEES